MATLLALTSFLTLPVFAISNQPLSTNKWLDRVNKELEESNRDSAAEAWAHLEGKEFHGKNEAPSWRRERCLEARNLPILNSYHARAMYLLCRGPLYDHHTSKVVSGALGEMERIYRDIQVCRTRHLCYKMEPDLAEIVATSRDASLLFWAYTNWRILAGVRAQRPYRQLLTASNIAARNNGYKHLGEAWLDELEIPGIWQKVKEIYQSIYPLFQLLHAWVRHELYKEFGPNLIKLSEPIPAHLIGNFWGNSWRTGDRRIPNISNWSMKQMVGSAEKYFVSLGLPRLGNEFWERSHLEVSNQSSLCHGAAVNMFNKSDFRISVCARATWDDFRMIHHELGHIYYYMAYDNLPTIFKTGANSAFHESIGDAIMLSVESPRNLDRMRIKTKNPADSDMDMLLEQALRILPTLGYALALDMWRWEAQVSETIPSNSRYWELVRCYQGLSPPSDIIAAAAPMDTVAKYHVINNTPYLKYFIASVLQFQILDVLCKAANQQHSPLSQCDLYNSTEAGHKLRKLMAMGATRPWRYILRDFSEEMYDDLSVEPLLQFFAPLQGWLQRTIRSNNIKIGWTPENQELFNHIN